MPFLKYTGLDKTTSDYGIVEQKTSKNMTFINGDVLKMPFEDNSFDFVFSLDMLEHIPKEKRLASIKEILRVSNKYSIIGFPFGKLGSLLDQTFYEYLKLKNGKVNGWLEEHIQNGLPDDDFIRLVKDEFKNYEIKEFLNGNVFFVNFILLLESTYGFSTFSRFISHIVAFFPINFNSKYGVRKFLMFTKK